MARLSGLAVFVLLAATLSDKVHAQTWTEPYFEAPPAGPGNVVFTIGNPPTLGTSDFDEGVAEGDKVALVVLTYTGTNAPTIFPGEGSDPENLGLELRQDATLGNKWVVEASKPQDFESAFKRYKIDVVAAGTRTYLTINVRNLNDNAPVFDLANIGCSSIKENTKDPTGCTFTLRDLDGIRPEDAVFSVEPADIFKLTAPVAGAAGGVTVQLEVIGEVDYETSQLYTLQLTGSDGVNEAPGQVILRIEDVADEQPVWVNPPPPIYVIDEESAQTTEFTARDGDSGSSASALTFSLSEGDATKFTVETIDGRTGRLNVAPIDRDAGESEFTIKIRAVEVADATSFVESEVKVIVNDINDRTPAITPAELKIDLEEGHAGLIGFPEIRVVDPDLGAAGQFRVELIDESEFGWGAAFSVIPNSGYQDSVFSISVTNSAALNFENTDWRQITLTLKVTEIADETHTATVPVTITITDKNDEFPQFSESEYEQSVPEILPVGGTVLQLVATDTDAGDEITYSILTTTNAVDIDPTTGLLTAKRDNPFDYELQQQIILQVAATDKASHRTQVQVTLNVEDANDSPPTISLPNEQPIVTENVDEGTLVTSEISAQDMDTTAALEFSIDWATSYATNKGVRVRDPTVYEQCLSIATKPVEGARASVTGELTTKGKMFDWEKFDTIYVSLVVTDTAQATNNVRRATLTIGVENVNDNPPQFVVETLDDKTVRENSEVGQAIGNVVATDPDLIGTITYSLDSDGTSPLDWVSINERGEIKTTDVKIDVEALIADELIYTVVASDGELTASEQIKIKVIDVNDETPVFAPPGGPFTILENSPDGTPITTVTATDADFSDPYGKNLQYELNLDLPELSNYFAVDGKTGAVTVKKKVGYELDRDAAPNFGVYSIEVVVWDNTPATPGIPNERNSAKTAFELNLEDVNDEKPIFENVVGDINIQEDIGIDGLIYQGVSAPDKDAPDTPFSTVSYSITKVSPATGTELFKLVQGNNKADIVAAADLRGSFGTYILTITATDGGGESNEKEFTVIINDKNDNPPVFVWPPPDFQLRVSVNQTIELPLNGEDDAQLRDIEGTDADDNSNGNGQIEYSITGDNDAVKYLRVQATTLNRAKFYVVEEFPEEGFASFSLTLLAKDKATEGSMQQTQTGRVFIMNKSEKPPYYQPGNDKTINWKEGDPNVSELLPTATDDNNQNLEPELHQKIYYHIIAGDADKIFTITHEEVNFENIPTIKLTDTSGEGLDSDEGPKLYELQVIASNTQTPPSGIDDERSVIKVTINVEDIADSPPTFPQPLYVGGIAPTDITNVEVIRITAIDTDENDPTTYSIVEGSMSASEDYLTEVMDTAFQIEPATGTLRTNFAPQDYMKGYFEFQVKATDTASKSATVDVTIYIINESNRVKFVFANELAEVDKERDFISRIFTENLLNDCAIDNVGTAEANNETVVEVRTHFVDSEKHVPVEGSIIEARASNVATLSTMRSQLLERQLNLFDVISNRPPEVDNLASILTITLIVVAVVLGSLVVILLVAFVVKTRGLNRRLEALSTTRFGSQESGLNRVAMNVPNTNKHAIEGSNPVWNEDVPNYDNNSQGSGDSDLIGIEDRPEFGYKDNQGYYGDFYGGGGNGIPVKEDNPDLPATYL